MKAKQRARGWLEDLWDYEDKHPVVFASPRALVEARLIAAMERTRRPRRRDGRNGALRERKAAVG
jgi:hypothetical protein